MKKASGRIPLLLNGKITKHGKKSNSSVETHSLKVSADLMRVSLLVVGLVFFLSYINRFIFNRSLRVS